jgi:hypothetical protein
MRLLQFFESADSQAAQKPYFSASYTIIEAKGGSHSRQYLFTHRIIPFSPRALPPPKSQHTYDDPNPPFCLLPLPSRSVPQLSSQPPHPFPPPHFSLLPLSIPSSLKPLHVPDGFPFLMPPLPARLLPFLKAFLVPGLVQMHHRIQVQVVGCLARFYFAVCHGCVLACLWEFCGVREGAR